MADDDSSLDYNRLSDGDGMPGAGCRSRLVRFGVGGEVAEDAPAYTVRDSEDFRRALEDVRRDSGGAADRFGCEVSLVDGEQRSDRDWVAVGDVDATVTLTPGLARALWNRVSNRGAAGMRSKISLVK